MPLSPEQEALAQARFNFWKQKRWYVETMGGPDVLLAVIRHEIEREDLSGSAGVSVQAQTLDAKHDSRLVHLEDGMFGEIAVIQDSQWVRSMRFGVNGPRQSIVDLIEPHTLLLRYAKVCMLGLAALTDCRSVLVVGLGAGSIPMFLRQFFPNAQIDVVEIDTAVVKVAKQFFMFHEDDRLKVFIEDGRTFADSTKKTYDLIIVDAYASEMMPEHLATVDAFHTFKSCLTTTGVLVANAWGSDFNEPFLQLVRSIRSVFLSCYVATVPFMVNRIVFASNHARDLSEMIIGRARQVSVEYGLPFSLEDQLSTENTSLNEKLLQLVLSSNKLAADPRR